MFSEAPLSEMIDTEALPEDVFGTDGLRLIEALSLAPDTDARIEAANQAFRAMLPQSARANQATALSAHIAGGTVRSGDIANGLGISERSFRRLWRSMTGIEHRNFATLMRFHRAIAMVDEGISLSAVAAECGYSDQPHMAREVKRISGLSPAQLKKCLGENVYGALYKDRPTSPWRTS